MRIIIVNENDIVIGTKERGEVLQEDIYRVSALWLTNSKGEILLAQRALGKAHDPGKWGPAAAGTVEEGETYELNMLKEAQEELGLVDIKPHPGPKVRHTGERNYFAQWYVLSADLDLSQLHLQREEVSAVRWISSEGLRNEFSSRPQEYLAGVIKWLELFSSKPLQ